MSWRERSDETSVRVTLCNDYDMINTVMTLSGQSDCLYHAYQFINTFIASQSPFPFDGKYGHSHVSRSKVFSDRLRPNISVKKSK